MSLISYCIAAGTLPGWQSYCCCLGNHQRQTAHRLRMFGCRSIGVWWLGRALDHGGARRHQGRLYCILGQDIKERDDQLYLWQSSIFMTDIWTNTYELYTVMHTLYLYYMEWKSRILGIATSCALSNEPQWSHTSYGTVFDPIQETGFCQN